MKGTKEAGFAAVYNMSKALDPVMHFLASIITGISLGGHTQQRGHSIKDSAPFFVWQRFER